MSQAAELSPAKRRIIVIGTLLGLLVAASNQTVVSTALPRIVGDLGGLSLLSWVFTAYMLTSTTVVPISGKLSDIFGRKPFFMGGILIFMTASVLAGMCQNMEQLIVLRGVQGLGGGMLMATAFAVIGDLFSPSERGRYQGLFTSTFALASIVGPTVGGTLTDHLSWRYVFYINLPFGIAALMIFGSTFPSLARPGRKVIIDYTGIALLTASIVCVLLALVWGGDVYAWGSAEIVGLLVAGGLMLAAFLWVETRAPEPVLPLHLFRGRVFAVGILLTFVTGIVMTVVITFTPLFLQGVLGASATNSGLVLSPMMIGVVVASTLGGYLISRTGRYRTMVIAGGALLLGGMFGLSRLGPETSWPEAIAVMVLVGSGIGLALPVINLAIQNSVLRQYLGVATSSSQFFRQIGATLGVAVFGTLVVTGITSNLDRNLPAEVRDQASPQLLAQLEDANVVLSPVGRAGLRDDFDALPGGPRLYEESLHAIRMSLSDAVTDVFFIGFVVSCIAFAISLVLPERPLATRTSEAQAGPRGAPQTLTPPPASESPSLPAEGVGASGSS